jgi:hypothetical protein
MTRQNVVDHGSVADLLHVELFRASCLGQDLEPARQGMGFIFNSLPENIGKS